MNQIPNFFLRKHFLHKPPTIFRQIIFRLIFLTFLTILIRFSKIIFYKFIFINFVNLYIKLCKFIYCMFYYLNSIFNIEYFIVKLLSCLQSLVLWHQWWVSDLTSIIFIDFAQLYSTKDAHYFFTPLSFTFLWLEYNSNNRKTILSLERTKYQPRTKERSF